MAIYPIEDKQHVSAKTIEEYDTSRGVETDQKVAGIELHQLKSAVRRWIL